MYGRMLIRMLLWNNVLQAWYGHCSLEFSGAVGTQGGHVKIATVYSVLWIGSEENCLSQGMQRWLMISREEVTQGSNHPQDFKSGNKGTFEALHLLKDMSIISELLGEEFFLKWYSLSL